MAPEFGKIAVIRTKLQRPHPAAGTIARPRLFALLAEQRPLTLVVAPAGFGKTTLVSSWLETTTVPYGWLTLDEGDSDPAVFLTYLLAALQVPAPGAGKEILALLNARGPIPPNLLARALINDLYGIEQPFVVVLDDYHLLQGEAVHAIVRELLLHPPLALHLVLAARQAPPLPIAGLRARGLATEIHAEALRFTTVETAEFLRRVLDVPVSDATSAVLAARAEGWIAGLRLAAISLRDQQDPAAAASRGDADDRQITDYLAGELLQQQPPALQAFLVKTSILDRLCGPLCKAVLGTGENAAAGESAPEHLRWLEENNLFLFALDAEARWYRYHPLFQRLLQRRLVQVLTPVEIAALHARASAWLAGAGYADEALTHAIAAGDMQAAVHLLAQQRHELMNREEWRTLYRWLCLFDRATIDQHPDLLLTEAWLMLIQRQGMGSKAASAAAAVHSGVGAPVNMGAVMLVLLQKLAAALAREQAAAQTEAAEVTLARLGAEAAVLRCAWLYFSAAPAAIVPLASDALALLPPTWQMVRSHAVFVLAAACQMRGELAKAYSICEDSPQPPLPDLAAYQAQMGVNLCLIQWVAADLPALLRTARRALSLANEPNLPQAQTWTNYYIGGVYYHWNELDRAVACLEPLVQNPYGVNGTVFANATCVLALAYQAQGRSAEARAITAAAVDHLRAADNLCLNLLEIFQVELALRQGKLGAATQWAALHAEFGPLAPVMDFVAPQLVRPKILLAQTSAAARQEAVQLLLAARDYFAAIHNTRFLLETLALLALAWWEERDTEALGVLAEALRLAAPGGLVRVFVDLGPRLLRPLELLAARNVAPAFTAQIVAALLREHPAAAAQSDAGLPARRLPARADQRSLIEALTPREQEILALLAQRLTNKEIAHALSISADTVKEHISNLLGKLAVGDRRAAVAKAAALGLLPPV
jgi:LuxR family maltose regulon positive regulatory protein